MDAAIYLRLGTIVIVGADWLGEWLSCQTHFQCMENLVIYIFAWAEISLFTIYWIDLSKSPTCTSGSSPNSDKIEIELESAMKL